MAEGNTFESGFTILEMLIVVTIIGLLTTFALPRLKLDDGSRMRTLTHVLEADLRVLRATAMNTSIPTGLEPTDDGYILVPSGTKRIFPKGFTLSKEAREPGYSTFVDVVPRFFDDGSSSIGVLLLKSTTSTVRIGVRGFDGRIVHGR